MAKRKQPKFASFEKLMASTLILIKQDIANNMYMYKRNASFRSLKSLNGKVTQDGIRTTGILYGSKSFKYMEKGRGNGKIPHNFTEIIKEWIIDKGIPIRTPRRGSYSADDWPRAVNRAAHAIAFSIRQHGTELYPFGKPQDIFSTCAKQQTEYIASKSRQYLYDAVLDIFYFET